MENSGGNGETLRLNKEEMQAKFQGHFKEAERLVKGTGYHRRDGEVEDLRITISDFRSKKKNIKFRTGGGVFKLLS